MKQHAWRDATASTSPLSRKRSVRMRAEFQQVTKTRGRSDHDHRLVGPNSAGCRNVSSSVCRHRRYPVNRFRSNPPANAERRTNNRCSGFRQQSVRPVDRRRHALLSRMGALLAAAEEAQPIQPRNVQTAHRTHPVPQPVSIANGTPSRRATDLCDRAHAHGPGRNPAGWPCPFGEECPAAWCSARGGTGTMRSPSSPAGLLAASTFTLDTLVLTGR